MVRIARILIYITIIGVILSGCGAKKTVSRIEPDQVTDLSGRWNDTDSRLVSQEMINDCLNHPWLSQHMTKTGKKPAIIVGSMRNKSSEHIAVKTFVNDIERAFINSGQVTVVASATDREELRSEKEDQRIFASPETIKEMGKELGADYMMTGEINTIVDQENGKKVIFYQTDLTLTSIETNVKVWIGQKKIKKFISRSRFSS
ncbi:MAG: penicillin-binding protein activator LpoB [bacterium]